MNGLSERKKENLVKISKDLERRFNGSDAEIKLKDAGKLVQTVMISRCDAKAALKADSFYVRLLVNEKWALYKGMENCLTWDELCNWLNFKKYLR